MKKGKLINERSASAEFRICVFVFDHVETSRYRVLRTIWMRSPAIALWFVRRMQIRKNAGFRYEKCVSVWFLYWFLVFLYSKIENRIAKGENSYIHKKPSQNREMELVKFHLPWVPANRGQVLSRKNFGLRFGLGREYKNFVWGLGMSVIGFWFWNFRSWVCGIRNFFE